MNGYRVLTGMLTVLALLLAIPAFAADTVYYYSSDTVHSEVVITDQNRNVVERTYYAPYGAVLNRDLRDGPGYGGHHEDPETGLVYMQQRYYCPECGRFLSVDPVGADPTSGGNFNRYEYAQDNPYRYADPDGRESGDLSLRSAEYTQGNLQAFDDMEPNFSMQSTETIMGMAPIVGDVQNVVDAYNNPSVVSIAIAAVGLVPEAGAAIADVAKIAKVAEAAKEGATVVKSAVGIGEHAGESITARSAARDFTTAERTKINEIGSTTGCHTCGTKNPGTKSGNFVPDHQPASALNTQGGAQRLYPQCLQCSRQQGLEIARKVQKEKQ